jgi:hypothetical protein
MENQALIEHRFKAGTPIPRHTQKHPNGYLTCKLKRFLKKKIKFEDPETQQFIKGNVGDALMWRLILNGTQGDNQAISEILDRVEGKLNAKNGNGEDLKRLLIQIINYDNHPSPGGEVQQPAPQVAIRDFKEV